eukprot:3720727-Pleurochrysis_carterae.AAC.4
MALSIRQRRYYGIGGSYPPTIACARAGASQVSVAVINTVSIGGTFVVSSSSLDEAAAQRGRELRASATHGWSAATMAAAVKAPTPAMAAARALLSLLLLPQAQALLTIGAAHVSYGTHIGSVRDVKLSRSCASSSDTQERPRRLVHRAPPMVQRAYAFSESVSRRRAPWMTAVEAYGTHRLFHSWCQLIRIQPAQHCCAT